MTSSRYPTSVSLTTEHADRSKQREGGWVSDPRQPGRLHTDGVMCKPEKAPFVSAFHSSPPLGNPMETPKTGAPQH